MGAVHCESRRVMRDESKSKTTELTRTCWGHVIVFICAHMLPFLGSEYLSDGHEPGEEDAFGLGISCKEKKLKSGSR